MKLTDAKLRALKPNGKAQELSDGGRLYVHLSPVRGSSGGFFIALAGNKKCSPSASALMSALERPANGAMRRGNCWSRPWAKEKKGKPAAAAADHAKAMTYEVVAREWFATYSSGWTESNRAKILARQEKDVFPFLGRLPIGLKKRRFREAAHWLIDGPLDTGRENGYL